MFLETHRMIFFNFEEDDYELIKDLDSDPDVVRFISNGNPSDKAEVDRALRVFLTYNLKYNNKLGYWKAMEKNTGEFIGWFHFRPLKSNPEDTTNIELGYRLKKKFWGLGLATEGSLALIEKGAKELNIKKVWAQAMLANTASINVMKKLGLKLDYEDIYEEFPGQDKRCVWYSMKCTL